MNLARCNKIVSFLFGLAAFIFFPQFLSGFHLFYFAPFIIICYYQSHFIDSLWASIFCGFIVDCFSVLPFFGLNALIYCLVSLFLYRQRSNFFADRLSTLPIMTYLFVMIATLLMMFSVSILEHRDIFSWSLAYYDLLVMPLLDGLYAFVFFVIPFSLFQTVVRTKRKTAWRRRRA